MEAVIRRHLDWFASRKVSPASVDIRRQTLDRLSRWAQGPILYLTHGDLTRWQEHRSRQLSASSLRSEITQVQQFYLWAVRDDLLAADPSALLAKPRSRRTLPRPADDSMIRACLAAAEASDKLIFALSALAGLRAAEIAGLSWSAVDLSGRRLLITGKGGRDRVVPISSTLAGYLEAAPQPHRGPVIRRQDGRPGYTAPSRVGQRAGAVFRMLGYEHARLHMCRHRLATRALEACHDVRVVQEILGHAELSTTATYTHVSTASRADAVEAAGELS